MVVLRSLQRVGFVAVDRGAARKSATVAIPGTLAIMYKNHTTMKLLFIPIILFLFSCNQRPENQIKEQIDDQPTVLEQNTEYLNELEITKEIEIIEAKDIQRIDPETVLWGNDTIIRFTYKGTTKEYIIDRRNYDNVREFERFIHNVNDRFIYKTEGQIDITGDGVKNSYSTLIEQRQDGFLITNTINENGEVIWVDSLLVDDTYSWFYLSGQDNSLTLDTKPYSLFYIAYKASQLFICDPKYYEGNRELHLFWLNNYVDDTEYWENYLDNFKGRTIFHLCFAAPHEYIWDRRAKKFVPIRIP